MALTGKQTHILDNLARVQMRLPSVNKRDRYLLDGEDITMQVNSLRARRAVHRLAGGTLTRLPGQQIPF